MVYRPGACRICSRKLPICRTGRFYWLREIVTRPQDTAYSYFLTRSDILLPHVADYLHRLNYSFNWIPYYGSRGYDVWPTFGFDQAYLQPNYYWKAEHDMEKIFDQIAQYDMAMELEFEPTLLHAREGSEAFRKRFRSYMEYAKSGTYTGPSHSPITTGPTDSTTCGHPQTR